MCIVVQIMRTSGITEKGHEMRILCIGNTIGLEIIGASYVYNSKNYVMKFKYNNVKQMVKLKMLSVKIFK